MATVYASNPNLMKYSSGASYGAGWHSRPGMTAGGSINFDRYSPSDSTVHFSGTIETTLVIGDTKYPNNYSYPITAKMFVGDSLVGEWTIFDYNGHNRDYGTKSINISGEFTLADNNTDVNLYYYCNGGGPESCDSKFPTTKVGTFKLPAGTLPYNPWTDPTNVSSVANSATVINPGGTFKVNWKLAQAGQGNHIGKYNVSANIYRNGRWEGRFNVASVSPNISEVTINTSTWGLTPNCLIQTDVDTWIVSDTAGRGDYWLGAVYARNNNVTVNDPWTNPTKPSNVKNNVTQIKPDGTLTVSWNASTPGTGNYIDYYLVSFTVSKDGGKTWGSRYSVGTTKSTSLNINLDTQILLPGYLIKTDVDAYFKSTFSWRGNGWAGYTYASNNNVTVYKSGKVLYKKGTTLVECTKAYANKAKNKCRYIRIKTGTTTRVIDMYTYKYN